jgi:hypothetical protein
MASREYREIVTPATDTGSRTLVSSSILEPFIIDLLVPSQIPIRVNPNKKNPVAT